MGVNLCKCKGYGFAVCFFFSCSDFPFVVPECGYGGAWSILPEGFAPEEQIRGLMSTTAYSLFRGT